MTMTVAAVIAELQKLPQDLPVLGGCHYDNDDGLTDDIAVRDTFVAPAEARFFDQVEPSWGYANTFRAVVIA